MALVMASSLAAVLSSSEVRKCSTNFSMLSGRQNDPFGDFFSERKYPANRDNLYKVAAEKVAREFFYCAGLSTYFKF